MRKLAISPGAAVASIALLMLVLVMGAANLWASYAIQRAGDAARQQQGRQVERELCLTFGRLSALQPPRPAGHGDPSRLYLAREHAILVQLGADIRCPRPVTAR